MTLRHRPLEGTTNFRDLGGYGTAAGRALRWGVLFRSSSLAQLTERDLDHLAGLGLRTICDFRGDDERAEAPSRLPAASPPRVVHLGIRPKVSGPLQEILRTGETGGIDVRDLVIAAYRAYARDHVRQYRGLFEELSDPGNYPLLFHCAAGKDRTGFAAAIVLSALGVPRDTVFEDYVLTNQYWRSTRLLPPTVDPAVRQALLTADPAYLEAAFLGIDEAFGSFAHYLRDGLGVTPAIQAKLERNLLG